MFASFWKWLREQTRQAILAGVQDAADALAPGGEHAEAVERLRQLAGGAECPCLPPPEANGTEAATAAAARKRK